MGYYTYFEFDVIGADADEVEQAIKDESGYEEFYEVKWYDHVQDLKAVSLKYPDATIIVTGTGEESHDLWKKWFRGGKMKMARARIEFDEPSEYDDKESRRW